MDDAEDQQLRKEMVVSQKEVGGSAQDLSNEKRAPGCLGYFGGLCMDYTLPSYIGILINMNPFFQDPF